MPELLFGEHAHGAITEVNVALPSRGEILRVMAVFADQAADALRPAPPPQPPSPPTVFVGHGRSPLWRDLKDHLHEQHGYEVVAYETGARAGHTIRDIVNQMMDESSFAVLVMTAEDVLEDGTERARQNVVHETGLFQGRLGFDKAIVAIEQGVEPFSNLQGIHQLRFSKGNIKEVYGDVLATLLREFSGQ
jgi:predicted nucleotide-binding protein